MLKGADRHVLAAEDGRLLPPIGTCWYTRYRLSLHAELHDELQTVHLAMPNRTADSRDVPMTDRTSRLGAELAALMDLATKTPRAATWGAATELSQRVAELAFRSPQEFAEVLAVASQSAPARSRSRLLVDSLIVFSRERVWPSVERLLPDAIAAAEASPQAAIAGEVAVVRGRMAYIRRHATPDLAALAAELGASGDRYSVHVGATLDGLAALRAGDVPRAVRCLRASTEDDALGTGRALPPLVVLHDALVGVGPGSTLVEQAARLESLASRVFVGLAPEALLPAARDCLNEVFGSWDEPESLSEVQDR